MAGKKESGKGKERSETGIPGFDKLCEGGFYANSINLVIGSAGSGKTTFGLQYLYHGATKAGENGLYISFEPETKELFVAGKKQGMDFEELDKKGSVKIVKLNNTSSIAAVEKQVKDLIKKYNAKRVCFDPLNVFALDLPAGKNPRKQIYDLTNALKSLGVTVVLVAEANEETVGVQNLPEEVVFAKFFADSVTEIYASGLGGAGDRSIRIAKMRMTNNVRGPQSMEITDKGIRIL